MTDDERELELVDVALTSLEQLRERVGLDEAGARPVELALLAIAEMLERIAAKIERNL